METFSALLAICAGNHRYSVNSPHKGQWRGALMFSLICTLNKQLSKQSWREAGDLRRNHVHYDVIVMVIKIYATHQSYATFLALSETLIPWLCNMWWEGARPFVILTKQYLQVHLYVRCLYAYIHRYLFVKLIVEMLSVHGQPIDATTRNIDSSY